MIGPLLGLAGYQLLDHRIRPLLWVAVVPAVLSVLLVAAVRERRREDPVHRPRSFFAGAGELQRRYWQVVAVLALFSLVNFPDALLLLRLHDIGFSVTGLFLAYVGYNVVYAAASYPAGALADRLPRPQVFGIGLMFFAVGYLGPRTHPQPHHGVARAGALRTLQRLHRRRRESLGVRPGAAAASGQRTRHLPKHRGTRGAGGRHLGGPRLGR